MKLAVLLVTRGNPKRAAAVVECARSLSSGLHEIEYLVGCDADDAESYNYFRVNYPGIVLSVDKRPNGVGAVWNRLAKRTEADIYCPFPDDSWVASPGWDAVIAHTMKEAFPDGALGVLAWDDLANPGQCTLPIVTKEWLGLTGRLYDERFPFWFYDTCVDEVYSFVTGRPVFIHPMLKLAARKGLTQRMRDLSFWWDFYVATRTERLEQARQIRKRLGIDVPDEQVAGMVLRWEARDARGRENLAAVEEQLASKSSVSPEYVSAKRNAEEYLKAA